MALVAISLHQIQINDALSLIDSRKVMQAITQGRETRDIARLWQARLDEFRKLRAKCLFY